LRNPAKLDKRQLHAIAEIAFALLGDLEVLGCSRSGRRFDGERGEAACQQYGGADDSHGCAPLPPPAWPGSMVSTVRLVATRYLRAVCWISSGVTLRNCASRPLMRAGSSSNRANEASRSTRPKREAEPITL